MDGKHIRGLQNLVHALGAQSTLHQVANGYRADEGSETGILALLFGGAVLEDLGWVEGSLRQDAVSISACMGGVKTLMGGGGDFMSIPLLSLVQKEEKNGKSWVVRWKGVGCVQ